MSIARYTEEENDLYWEVFFQGLEQPCEQMFQEIDNLVINLKEGKEENNEHI